MHILLIHQAFTTLDEPGGTRHYELARGLAAAGHRVTVIASPVSYLTGKTGSREPVSKEGVAILRAGAYSALHRSFAHRVIAFFGFMVSSFWLGLRVREVDLVWGTSPPIFQGLTALVLAQLKRVPFLFEVRDLWPAFAVAVGVLRSRTLIRMTEWLEGLLYRRADRVMVNSPGFVEHVRARGARSVSLVPNGADPAMFDPDIDGSRFRAEHGLDGRFVALYAGAHGLSNDLDVVLEAAALLADRPGLEIVLLGDGKEKGRLMGRAEAMGLKNLRFLPPVPKLGMREALAAADACIAILKPVEAYRTVYPNKVFDYLAAGRPVVLAIEGVIREVVEAAGAGIPVPPGDPGALAGALRELAADPERSRWMGRAGRAYVEVHFDRARLVEELVRIVEEFK
ncbi:MAG TPA: glycosyltransferase family 4 protein [Anaerolineales bacterium]|nr:glycosyltransferase family 4 protein [Anaerolineales bacterium]